jgi:ribonuclease-3
LSRSPDGLTRALNFQFADAGLLEAALTHRSAGARNNERLEFLGDAVLGYLIAEWLFRRFPRASEGQLSRLRASLVKRATLAEVARRLELGEHMRLGPGELKSGGFRRDSMLADTLEAILGAMLLDSAGGLEACRACVQRLFAGRVDSLSPAAELKDPKTRLQELLQARRLELPVYDVTELGGEAHQRSFTVECRVAALGRSTTGQGKSRRAAEQDAAAAMLEKLDT